MRRIAVINQKGGVGKTTTTANLAAALALSGADVFLVDLDPQGHLSLHFGVEPGDGQPTVYDVLTAGTPIREAAVKVREHVTIVPADIDLAGAESELVSVMGREVLLREAITAIGEGFDYLLIDCPPSLNVLTVNALVACEEVLIPLQAHFLALQGLGKLLDTVALVRQRINPRLTVSGVVLCMHESATRLANEVVDDLLKYLDSSRRTDAPWAHARLFDTCIRRNIKLAECASFGQTIFDYAPKSNGAADYAKLAEEIFQLPDDSVRVGENGAALRTKAVPLDETDSPAAIAGNGRGPVPTGTDRARSEVSLPIASAPHAAGIPAESASLRPDDRRA